jgi:hypothetical protein
LRRILTVIALTILVQGCAPTTAPNGGPQAELLSGADYMALSPEQKYAVTSKLLTSLYKGTPANEFFDLSQGLSQPVLQQDINHLEEIKKALDQPLPNLGSHISTVFNKHFTSSYQMNNTRAIPMAVLYELPLSRDMYVRWMAYKLTNTILFSPALELDSVSPSDVEAVYNSNLVYEMNQGKTIAEIAYHHMISLQNWRRFRSPEDNVREMMEIFLMRFRDDEVPKAAIACKNWYLTDDRDGYQLRKSADINTTPQTILDRNDITSCYDFYRAITQHPSFIPAVVRRIVDSMFAGYPAYQRASLADSIARQHPVYFKDIFNAILFSREYLLKQSRTKSYEEALMGTGSRIHWFDRSNVFYNLNDGNPGDNPPDLQNMRQENMTYKLGRSNDVPIDSLAFAYFHKSLRDSLMLDRRTTTSTTNTSDGGWAREFIEAPDVAELGEDDFIHYLMLSAVGRKAYPQELDGLKQIISDAGYQNNRTVQALLIMDYASRLSEFYNLTALR